MVFLEARGISKRFPGVQALDRVALQVDAGELVALIGENGAGKSTLMKILAGVESADAGVLFLDGSETRIDSVPAALEHGIALIHQELVLADNLDIAANVWLGREPRTRLGQMDRRTMRASTQEILARLGLDMPATTPVRRLSIAERQLVEVAKALSVEARLLILDEPTSSLSERETERLFALLDELRAQGVALLYITHRMAEVERLADRVVVLRDGRNSGSLARGEIDRDRMVSLMVGRDVRAFYRHGRHEPGEVVLRARGLRGAGLRHAASFSLRRGEILGVAGLVGAGRTELAETLFGLRRIAAGSLEVGGAPCAPRDPRAAIEAGLALVPEDRKQQGLILDLAIQANVELAGLPRWSRRGSVRLEEVARIAREQCERLGVRAPSLEVLAAALSGGNQQKVVLAKWLALAPRVLILDEPTRGVDVVAKGEIYRLLDDLARSGIGILLISSELQEILGVADRTLVMHEGRITGCLDQDAMNEEAVMQLATGGAPRSGGEEAA